MTTTITIEQQIASVKREIAFRARCYPKWVEQGKMKAEVAQHERRAMQAVLATLERLVQPLRRDNEVAAFDGAQTDVDA